MTIERHLSWAMDSYSKFVLSNSSGYQYRQFVCGQRHHSYLQVATGRQGHVDY